MSSLKDKLKIKKNLKEQIEKEGSGGHEKDTRILNYFDMDFGQKMQVLIVPDPNGELWNTFKKHGPNMNVRGLPSIGCLNDGNNGGDCPICQKAYDNLDLERETGDKGYRDIAKKWFPRESRIMNVVVLDSPVTINESSDGNQVKLMYVPRAIEVMIKEHITEGVLTPEDLVSTPLIIKKTKRNDGGMADYGSSMFARKTVEDDVLAVFDDFVIEPFDLFTVDIVPKEPTTEELSAWIEKAESKLNDGGGSKNSTDEEPDDSVTVSGGSAIDRLRKKKNTPQENSDKEEKEVEVEQESSGESVMERLKRLRNA